jgi:hypothetical protein
MFSREAITGILSAKSIAVTNYREVRLPASCISQITHRVVVASCIET